MSTDSLWVYLDGEYMKRPEAKISIFDHGLMYGDGVFEGIRAFGGVVFKLDEHITRLFSSAKMIKLQVPASKEDIIVIVLEVLRRCELQDAYIRVVVTRGVGPVGLSYLNCPKPTFMVFAEPIVSTSMLEEKGVSAIVSSIRRDPVDATTHEIKSLNYLNSIMAKTEAIVLGIDEAIMLDTRGFVSEATTTNIFIVKNLEITTPPATAGILHGITRDRVIELARELGYLVTVRDMTIYEVVSADEVFLVGTYAGIIPMVELKRDLIGDGKPGLVTRRLIEVFKKIAREPTEGTVIYTEK